MKLSGLVVGTLGAVVSCFPGFGSHNVRDTLETSNSGALRKLVVPNILIDDPTVSILESFNGMTLDTPKVVPRPNATGMNWWYFDAVNQKNLNESVVVIFYLTTNASFPLRYTTDISVSVDVFLTFADGTSSLNLIDAVKGEDGSAEVTFDTQSRLTTGNWKSTGLSWTEFNENGKSGFVVEVDNAQKDIKGCLKLITTAPPHLPCSEDVRSAGELLEAAPELGWTNSVPDANATVHFTQGNMSVNFDTGVGYHDQKWSVRPFQFNVKDYYWGHARVGTDAYETISLVWMLSVNHAGVISGNAYITQEGRTIFVGCSRDCTDRNAIDQVVKVESKNDHSFITFTLPEGKQINLIAEKTKVLGRYGPFTRWSGKAMVFPPIEGTHNNSGITLMQEFHF